MKPESRHYKREPAADERDLTLNREKASNFCALLVI
jgi:hypothetical protein